MSSGPVVNDEQLAVLRVLVDRRRSATRCDTGDRPRKEPKVPPRRALLAQRPDQGRRLLLGSATEDELAGVYAAVG